MKPSTEGLIIAMCIVVIFAIPIIGVFLFDIHEDLATIAENTRQPVVLTIGGFSPEAAATLTNSIEPKRKK